MSKETFIYVIRDLYMRQTRPNMCQKMCVDVSKESSIYEMSEENLNICQKRHLYVS